MGKRKQVVDTTATGQLADDAGALLRRLIDDEPLRRAVATILDRADDAAPEVAKAKAKVKAEKNKAARRAELNARQAKNRAKTTAREAKKKGKFGKLLGLGLVAGTGALAVSEGLRSKLLDALFGSEEEFQYTPSEPAPEPPTGAPGTPPAAA